MSKAVWIKEPKPEDETDVTCFKCMRSMTGKESIKEWSGGYALSDRYGTPARST
jgi:hypothetical protein